MIMEKEILINQLQLLSGRLKQEQNSEGFWSGRLSSSALSTANCNCCPEKSMGTRLMRNSFNRDLTGYAITLMATEDSEIHLRAKAM